jgi:hypothetical protein
MDMIPKNWRPLQRLPQVDEVYMHQNGLAYEVIALANDTEREQICVILKGADGCVWSRDIGNFMGLKENKLARFRPNQYVNESRPSE